MNDTDIGITLQALGERVPSGSSLVLIGGSALALLGSPRLTIDIDFVGDDKHPSELHKTIMQAAKELKVPAEPVPLERIIPLPEGHPERSIRIGQFGNLEVFIADPISIALSKIDRGYDTDLDDVVFLVQHEHVSLDELERIIQDVLARAHKYDFHPQFPAHFQELKNRLR